MVFQDINHHHSSTILYFFSHPTFVAHSQPFSTSHSFVSDSNYILLLRTNGSHPRTHSLLLYLENAPQNYPKNLLSPVLLCDQHFLYNLHNPIKKASIGEQPYYVTSKIVVHLNTVLSFPFLPRAICNCVVSLSIFVQFLCCAFPLNSFCPCLPGGRGEQKKRRTLTIQYFLSHCLYIYIYLRYILRYHFISLDTPSGRAKCLSCATNVHAFNFFFFRVN